MVGATDLKFGTQLRHKHANTLCTLHKWAGGSSVGIATHYDLDGPQIEFRWGRDFLYLSSPALWFTQSPVQWVPGLSRGKADGASCWLHPSTAEVKERVQLYLFSLSGPSWSVTGWTLHCLHIKYCHEWVMTWPCEYAIAVKFDIPNEGPSSRPQEDSAFVTVKTTLGHYVST